MGRIILWALGGLVLGPIITLALATVAIPIFDISQMEGAYAMGVVFTLMPIGAVVGLIAGIIWAIARRP
jgi:mannose/fructose/N-acetylgalactosamine-specific phosphotransferase system component IID